MMIRAALAVGIAAALGTCLLGTNASAQHAPHRHVRPAPAPKPCSVSVEDAHGHSLTTYLAGGKTFILGEQGERYSIRVRNRTGERVEAVVTVDGRDVINGKSGDYVRNRGYVVGPHDSVSIKGFRQNLDRVATFRFSSPRSSYSAKLGTPQNVGVIGIACFTERPQPVAYVPPPHWHNHDDHHHRRRAPRSSAKSGSAPSADAAEAAPSPQRRSAGESRGGYAPPPRGRTFNLGTEYGESRFAPVSTTNFIRRTSALPQQLSTIHYDNAEGLEARGIQVYWFPAPEPVYIPPHPHAFPDSRFAPPPPR